MENLRVILAVISLLVGIALLIFAGIRTGSKKSGAVGSYVFGGLFLIAALVLWIRGSEPQLTLEPRVTEATPDAIADSTASEPEQTHGGKSTANGGEDTAEQPSSESASVQKDNPPVTKQDKPAAKTAKPAHRAPKKRTSSPSISRPPNLPRSMAAQNPETPNWRDRVYAAISSSFDWIEEFFDKYATPVPAEPLPAEAGESLAQKPKLEFPEIQFNKGTAELTGESQNRLKALAGEMRRKYPNSHFEIQAYVDSVGPEAFNYVLTQARADAVRDLLISEGVQASHLIARGYGTGSDPALAESRIQFVARR